MKIKICFFYLLVLFFCIITSNITIYANNTYTITKYDVNIKVNENNTFEITENITAHFENSESHGIIRTIPLIRNIYRLDGSTINST